MSLQSLLDLSSSRNKKIGLSEERIRACMPEVRKTIALYREYPDLFIDDIKEEDSETQVYNVFKFKIENYEFCWIIYKRTFNV